METLVRRTARVRDGSETTEGDGSPSPQSLVKKITELTARAMKDLSPSAKAASKSLLVAAIKTAASTPQPAPKRLSVVMMPKTKKHEYEYSYETDYGDVVEQVVQKR